MRGTGGDHGAGDEWVDLREVVVAHHREIFRYARAFSRTDADAEDLAQTAVVRALQRGTIVSDADGAKWYVMRIVRNLATDQARRRARISIDPFAELPDVVSSEPAPDVVADRVPDDDRVPRAAFADLPDVHREVLRLRFLEELGYDDVAARLHTTEHGARQRVYRAMQELRSLITDRKYRPTT